jgi:heme O synthase-like polyprenyltransferase
MQSKYPAGQVTDGPCANRDWIALLKPRVMSLVVFTGF